MLLKMRGPQTAQALGDALGISGEGARQHLVRLAGDGLVGHEEKRAGVGRPVRLWSLTAAGHARFPDTHAELTVQLIDSVRQLFGEAGLDRLIDAREAASETAYPARKAYAPDLAGPAARVARSVLLRMGREGDSKEKSTQWE